MDAAVHFMLAAGNGEDEVCLLSDGIVQRKVRSHIAGMECYDHVNIAIGQHIFRYIRMDEFQTCIAVFLRDLTAALHHIRFQIVADDGGGHAALDGKVIVEDESQIGFAAAKVQNGDLVFAIILKGMVDQFDKAIDLLVLVIFGPDDFEILGKDTQIHQGGNILTLFEDVFLLPVVGADRTGQGNRGSGMLFIAAVLLKTILGGGRIGYHQCLPITALQVTLGDLQQLFTGNILVESFVIPKPFQLILQLPPQHHRTDADFGVVGLVNWLAEYRFGQSRESTFKIRNESCHIIHQRASSAAGQQPSTRSWSRSCWGQPVRQQQLPYRKDPYPPWHPPA